ncbi:protein SON [Porphyrio hochstetteri]
MATNIEEIFRSFVVSKMREIQEEQQQHHNGGKVEGQPNGDTIPAEQANPSDDTVAGAGSRQNDQIVQKIEEVLSGALDTELQCKSDVDKSTAKHSTQSTKRSSTGEDEIPRKKSKKNKKHKSKKKKKKKKKRKKEKKHKKQPKESKLSARHGEHADLQPASQLLPEKSSSILSVQHGGFGDANLAVHVQPEELCSKASEALDIQALGLVSHSRTHAPQPMENLESEKGTLCVTNPPFSLEGSQSDIQENASITQICTREEQIKQSHENIYPIAIHASEKSVLVDTGNNSLSSIPSGIANKSEIQQDSAAALASEVIQALKDPEVTLESKGIGELKAFDTALESQTTEVLKYSEASLQSVAQWGAKELEATSDSVSLASDVMTTPKSANQADLNTVKVAHVSVAREEVKIPEATEKSLHMANVKNVETSLELGAVSRTLEPALKPSLVSDNLRVMQCSATDGSSVLKAGVSLQYPFKISAAAAVTQVEISAKTPLEPGAVTKVKDLEPARSSVHVENVKALQEALQPIAVKPKTLEAVMEPVGVVAKDIGAAQECPQVQVVKGVEGTTVPATLLNVPGGFLQPKVLAEVRSVDRTQKPALPAELTGMNVVAEAKGLRATLEPVTVAQTFVPQTTLGIPMPESFTSPQTAVEVAALTGVRGRETSQAILQLENTNASKISESTLKPVTEAKDAGGSSFLRQPESRYGTMHCGTVARGVAATVDSTAVSKSSEINLGCMAGVGASSDTGLLAMKVTSVTPVTRLETTRGPVAESERKVSEADIDRARIEMKTASSHLQVEGMTKIQALESVLQPGTLSEEKSERTSESLVAYVSMEPVRDSGALAGMTHLKTTAEKEPKHPGMVAEPLGASKTMSSSILLSPAIVHTRTSQTEVVREIKDSELATSSATVEVKGSVSLSEVGAVAEVKDLEMAASETGPLMQGLGRTLSSEVVREMRHSEVSPEDPSKAKARSKEAILEPGQTVTVQTAETGSQSVLEQTVGHSESVIESLPGVEEKTMASEVTEMRNLRGTDVRTQGPTVEYIIATRKTSTKKIEPLDTNLKGLEEETEKAMEAKYLEPTSEAGEGRLFESMNESATVEVKGSETVKEPEVHMDIQGLETSQKTGTVEAMSVLEGASEAISEPMHTEKREHLQAALEAKPAAEWKSSEQAPEVLSAAEIKSSEAKPGDMKDLETTLEHEVGGVQYAEGVQVQQTEDVRVPGQAQECEILVEKKDAEQSLASEPSITETVSIVSHAADEKDASGTFESEIIRDTNQLEASPSHEAVTKDMETAPLPETVVELKDAGAAVGLEAETKDLEAAPVPETDTEVVPALVAEASQSEIIPQAEAVKEATPEQESEKRDSETSDVQPDVAARMRETLMRLEKVTEKTSHRSSDKKHDAKKQKRSRSKSQSRSRKRKKKSRSRSASRRLTSKRARSRSRNYSDSRKKHSKSRSRSVEKRERRVSSRRSRRRRSRSSDHYRSKSRSAEKRGSRLSSGRSRRRRSRSSDHYRSKSRSPEKRLSSRRSRRRRSRSSDHYRSKSRSPEKRLSSRRSGRRHSRSSDRYRSKSRSPEKRLSSRRSGRRRSRSSDRYRSKSRSPEKRLSSRRSGRRRSRSSDHYRSKSRSPEKRLSSRRSGRRRSRSSDRYRSKSRSAEKRGSRLSSRRSCRRRSRSSDHSKSRSRSSEKRGGKEYSWRFRNRGSGSSDRSKSRSRSVEKRGRKASLRRSKRQRSKSSDRYKSRSRSVEKRDRKQSSRKSKRQRSKSSDRYKSRSKSVEKKKESSRKSKRRRSKSSERYKSRSRSVEKKRKESSKKSKRKRSKSSDSVKSRSKSVEKRESKLPSAKCSSKHVESSELQESTKCLEKVDVPEPPYANEGSSLTSSNGPTSVALSLEGVNGPELPPASESEFSKTFDGLEKSPSSVEETAGQRPSVSEFDSSKTPDDQELRSIPAEKTQVPELCMSSENGSAEKTVSLESSSLPELTCSTPRSRSSSVEKRRDAENSSVTEFQLSASNEDESRSTSFKEVEGPEPLLTLESGCSTDDYKTISLSSGRAEIQGPSLIPEGVLPDLSGSDLRHGTVEKTELKKLQIPESESSKLADSPESTLLSFETVEAQKSFLAPEVTHSAFPDVCESASLPVERSQMLEPSLPSDSECFKSPNGHESGSSFAMQREDLPLMSEGGSFTSPTGNEQKYLPVEKVKVPDVSLTSECGPVENLDHLHSASSFEKMHEAVRMTVGQSCKSSEVHESISSVDKVLDGPTLSHVLEIDCSQSSEMHESGYLPDGKIESIGSSLMSKSGIPVCHDGHKAKLSLASEIRCSVFPGGYELTSTAVENREIQKPLLPLGSGFSKSAEVCESVSTPTEKLQAPVTSLTSESGLLLLPDSHELRPIPEILESGDTQILESRYSVSSDGHELTPTSFEKVEVEEPSQVSENEYTIGLDGPELTSTPAEKTEMRVLYQMSKERCSVSIENQALQSPSVERIEVLEPALMSENEYAVSWEGQELRSSSPEKVEMQEASVVPDNEYAVSSEHHELPSSLAEQTEVQQYSLPSENEYAVSPEGQEVTTTPAEEEVQEPSVIHDSDCTIFPEGQRLAEETLMQKPSLISDRQYAACPEGQELLSVLTEKTVVQERSLLSENEYDVSPEGHDLRSSPVEKEETEEPSETSESESSMSTDSQELRSTVVEKSEVQELSLSEGECTMSPEGQELQSSPAEKVGAKEPSLTSENEHALSPEEYESRLTHTERTEDMDSSLTSKNYHLLSFESQEVRFTSLQKADVQELSPAAENDCAVSPDGQELRFPTVVKADGLEPLILNDRASMSPDDSDLKSVPVEKMDDAMPSLIRESGYSMSPDGYSVKSGPGEEMGDLEPSLISERRHSTSSYQEGPEPRSPMDEEGLESSLTSEHRQSVSPEGHDQKSTIDEEMDDLEPSLTSEHRRSVSPDEHESRSSIEEGEYLEQPLTTERRSSVSSDEHESRSTTGEEVEDAEPSLTAERRDSISSDEHESRSTAGEDMEDVEPSLTAERRHSTSSDDHESRSTAGEEVEDLEASLTAEHRRSVSPDGRESRSTMGEEAEDPELSLPAERRHSTSSDDHESRSTTGEDVEDMEPSLTAEQRDSTSSDEGESRSTTGEEGDDAEPSLTTEHRRSTSPDGRESRSTIGEEADDVEPSLTAEQRDSTSSDEGESRSTTGEEGEDAEPSLADEDKQDSMSHERLEEQDSSFMPESRRSESSEREKSRSKSVDKVSDKESSQRSVSRHSKSPCQKSRSTSVEKTTDKESSRRSRRRRSRSAARQKSRSTSVEKSADKESSRRSRRRRSRSTARQRSQSTSVEKTADKESSRRSRRRRSRSAARQRSRSKSVEKAADKDSSRRSRSRRSRSSQHRTQRYDTESRSRRNRSRSVTRRRASRSKSNRRSRSSSLSRSRHRRRSRSRSASRRRRSLSRDRRKRSQRNRSRSTDRRRRRSDSRDRRISLRLRSRSRTPLRQRRSRSRGRRRSASRSPIRLRRSRSSGRRRYSRSPDRRRSRSSERFSSRSPKRLTDLDKAQLLEIAKANAAAMCAKSGVPLPPSLMPLLSQKKDDKASQKSSRDTLKELTEKCKKIAQSTDDVIVNKPHVSDEEEEERPFYNHPFKLSEPKPIFFNLSTPSIKPAPPPQPKNQVSLSKEFPVSSGSQHRKKEADSVYGEWVPVEKGKEDSKDDVFPKPSIEGVDITTAMNDRAVAQKRLNENTFDLEAMCMLNRAQEQIDAWAQSNSIPGQFTGSTGAQILSSDELTNSGPQAWIRKDQFLRAAPVTGGMGAQLMRKMGWREGEGLGKNKEGSVEPIMVDFKTDRKGLVAVGEKAQKRSGHYVVMKDLSGKHPVSALMEICNKRRWSPPEFVLVDDSGPDHRKHFIFKGFNYMAPCDWPYSPYARTEAIRQRDLLAEGWQRVQQWNRRDWQWQALCYSSADRSFVWDRNKRQFVCSKPVLRPNGSGPCDGSGNMEVNHY